MSEKPNNNQEDGGPLLQDLRSVIKKHDLKIKILPGMVKEVLTDIIQFVGKIVRSHEALEARVAALEDKRNE